MTLKEQFSESELKSLSVFRLGVSRKDGEHRRVFARRHLRFLRAKFSLEGVANIER